MIVININRGIVAEVSLSSNEVKILHSGLTYGLSQDCLGIYLHSGMRFSEARLASHEMKVLLKSTSLYVDGERCFIESK
jgi:hypothetical protein